MSNRKHAPSNKTGAHEPVAPDTPRGPTVRETREPLHGSSGQQQARQRADLAQHGVQIHERSRNVDRGASGKD